MLRYAHVVKPGPAALTILIGPPSVRSGVGTPGLTEGGWGTHALLRHEALKGESGGITFLGVARTNTLIANAANARVGIHEPDGGDMWVGVILQAAL
eukprot:15433619-Alexandrium_andersonii.AAC.1